MNCRDYVADEERFSCSNEIDNLRMVPVSFLKTAVWLVAVTEILLLKVVTLYVNREAVII